MEISLAPETIFHLNNFAVTNTLIIAYLISLLLIFLSILCTRKLALVPKGLQNFFELVIENLLKFIDSVTGERSLSIKFFPLIATIFIFVFCSNLIEIVPGLGTIGLKGVHEGRETIIPFIRSSSADLNLTIAIAVTSVLSVQFFGISLLGFLKYVKRFFVFPWEKPYFIGTFVGLLELIAEIAKIFSFSFRLFGNIFAGEVLLTVILFLVPYLVPLPFLFLEIFVGFIQATVFSMLTLVFLTVATSEHEDEKQPEAEAI